MTTPDLATARATAESTFDAACTISSDPEGAGDDKLDDATLALTPRTGDTTTVYTGPCMARPLMRRGQDQPIQGGEAQFIEIWRLRLPVTATGVKIGQTVTFTDSPNDIDLLERTFRITSELGGSLSVTRMFQMQERSVGPRV